MTDDVHIALIEEHLDYALAMIKKLEERILALELQQKSGVVYTAEFTPTDSYYWEHG